MTGLRDDIRQAWRSLRRSPVYAAIAIGSLALGIGANTAIFSVVHAVLMKPIDLPRADRLVAVDERDRKGDAENTSWATYFDWRARSRSFQDVAVSSYWSPKLSGGGGFQAEKLEGLRVSDGFFRVLGVRPALGRDFLTSEARPNAPRVAILSHALWVRRFGADPSVVGRTIRLSESACTVVGVLPRGFESLFSPAGNEPAEVWSPLRYDATVSSACRTCRHLRAIARLKDRVSLESAGAEMNALSRTLAAEHPSEYPAVGAIVTPFSRKITGEIRPVLWALFGSVAFVLLIACANVGSLLLSRAAGRGREVAVRVAIGASRGRIVRLFLTEALLLATLGGAAGLAAAAWLIQALVHGAPSRIPRLASASLDGTVLLFALGASLATGLLFGLWPALSMGGRQPLAALKEGGGPGRRGSLRARGVLVAFDAALAFLLVFGAGLLIRSTARLLDVDPGFRAAHVLKLEIHLSGPRYQKPESVAVFYDRVLERARAIPGVRSAGIVSQIPLGGDRDGAGVHPGATQAGNPEQDPSAERFGATPGYLAAMGIPVRQGRGISEVDRLDAPPVVLINETFARKNWPRGDAIGSQVRIGGTDSAPATIVGIVGDVRHTRLGEKPGSQIYLPAAQFTESSGVILVLRGEGNPASLASAARGAVVAVDPDQPITRVATLESVVDGAAATHRFATDLLAAFAALAVLLASIGIYGVISEFVAARRREIGIRVALGAPRGSILALILRRSVRLTAGGILIGTAGSLALGRGLRALLFEIGPADPAALAAGCAVVLAVSCCASLLPARRATRIDPMEALRHQ